MWAEGGTIVEIRVRGNKRRNTTSIIVSKLNILDGIQAMSAYNYTVYMYICIYIYMWAEGGGNC